MTAHDPFSVRLSDLASEMPEAPIPEPQTDTGGVEGVTWTQAVDAFIAEAKRGDEGSITTGWDGLDLGKGAMQKPIRPRELIVVTARTSVGKTWVLQHLIARALRTDRDHRVVLWPLEMSPEMMAGRILANALGVRPREVERIARDDELDRDLLDEAHGYLHRLAFAPTTPTAEEIGDVATQIAQGVWDAPPTIVVIDYVGLLKWGGQARASTYERVSENIKALKTAAMEHQLILLCAVQVSRGGGGAGDRPIDLDSLRDSGVIEEASDRIIGLWREAGENEDGVAGDVIHAKLLKNRHGPMGARVRLAYDEAMRLDVAPDQYEIPDDRPDGKMAAAGEKDDDIPY